jgi:hypothetical protein
MRSLLDWLCERIGLRLVFDGNLMAPDGTEPWWPAPEKETRGRALATYLLDDGGDDWPVEEIYALIEADGWAWDGRHWVEADHALA